MPTLSPEAPTARSTAPARTAADIRRWIVAELARSLNINAGAIDPAAAMNSLGVDSLAAIGMTGGLAGYLDRDLPATLLWDYPSIDALSAALANADDAAPARPPGLVDLQPLGDRPPLFCFPGERGHPVTFAPLAARLGLEQPCYGLIVPGLNGEQPPLRSVEAIAAAMIETVRIVQPHGPYQFLGYSFGGLLAFEAAQQLSAAGETVSLLAIYDTFTPAGRVRRPRWQQWAIRLYLRLKRPGRVKFLHDRMVHGPRPISPKEIEDREIATEMAGVPRSVLEEVRRTNSAATGRYHPKPYPGAVVLFRATERASHNRFYKMDRSNGWGAVARGGARVIPLAGTHANLLNADHAPGAAEALRPLLATAFVGDSTCRFGSAATPQI